MLIFFGRKKNCCSLISVLLALSFLLTFIHFSAITAQAQSETCTEAKADAEKDVNKFTWAIPGFLCGIFGWAFAYLSEPKVPVERVVGKSEEYVKEYALCYKEKAKKDRWHSACMGWGIGTAVALAMM